MLKLNEGFSEIEGDRWDVYGFFGGGGCFQENDSFMLKWDLDTCQTFN